jgi:hypothetical protein
MKTSLIILSAVLLTACGSPSVEDFAEDTELRRDALFECKKLKPSERNDSDECQNAIEAEKMAVSQQLKAFLNKNKL